MRIAPVSTPRASDLLLLLGVALFVGGLTVFVGGLRAPAHPVPAAGPGTEAAGHPGRPRAGPTRPAAPVAAPAGHRSANGVDRRPEPRRPDARVPQDRPARAGQAAPDVVSVGWSEQWHSTLMGAEDDGRDYLTRTANARRTAHWYQEVMGWGDSTGYRAVEASRAASDFAKGSSPATSEPGRNRTPSGPEFRPNPRTVDPARFSIGSEC
jgi:hypothetical protein